MVYRKRPLQLSLLLLAGLLFSCSVTTESPPQEEQESTAGYPEVLQLALAAHGGLEQWQQMAWLEYELLRDNEKVDHQLISLDTRKVLITADHYTLGFDGNEVWYKSDDGQQPVSDPRFYHNLHFYFVGMPFVFADLGIIYEPLGRRELDEKTYEALKISYESGVGDAPDDEYIVYFDPKTHQMAWLLYTVTYFTGEKSTEFSARHYQDWQWVNGLLLPLHVDSYAWNEGQPGDKKYRNAYHDLVIDDIGPDESRFLMPVGGQVAP